MTGIANLLAATTAFVGSHFLLSHPLRGPLTSRFGERGFLPIYGIVAIATFAWFIAAAASAPGEPVWWVAGQGVWDVATLVMLGAAILLAGSFVGNPAAVDPSLRPRIPAQPRGVLAITRHPMMWAFTLWGLVHAALWGSAANLIVAAGIVVLAFFGSRAQDAKKERLLGENWRAYEAKTSFWPFGAQVARRATWRAVVPGAGVLLGGLVFWLVATGVHGWLGGPVAGPWRWLAS